MPDNQVTTELVIQAVTQVQDSGQFSKLGTDINNVVKAVDSLKGQFGDAGKALAKLVQDSPQVAKALSDGLKTGKLNMDAFRQAIEATQGSMKALEQGLDGVGKRQKAIEGSRPFKRNYEDIERCRRGVRALGTQLQSYGHVHHTIMSDVNYSAANMVAGFRALQAISNTFLDSVAKIDLIAASYSRIMGAANSSLGDISLMNREFMNNAIDMAYKYSASITDVAGAMVELARQGRGANEIQTLTAGMGELRLLLASSTGKLQSMSSMMHSVTTMMNQMGVSASQAVDGLKLMAEYDIRAATSFNQISQALNRFAAAGQVANMSMDEMIRVAAAFTETGIQGSRAGTALNTIISRLSTNKDAIEFLKEMNVQSIMLKNGTYQVASAVDQLLQAYREASKRGPGYLERFLSVFGGTRQRSILAAGIKQLNKQTTSLIDTQSLEKQIRGMQRGIDSLTIQPNITIKSRIGKVEWANENEIKATMKKGIEELGSRVAQDVANGVQVKIPSLRTLVSDWFGIGQAEAQELINQYKDIFNEVGNSIEQFANSVEPAYSIFERMARAEGEALQKSREEALATMSDTVIAAQNRFKAAFESSIINEDFAKIFKASFESIADRVQTVIGTISTYAKDFVSVLGLGDIERGLDTIAGLVEFYLISKTLVSIQTFVSKSSKSFQAWMEQVGKMAGGIVGKLAGAKDLLGGSGLSALGQQAYQLKISVDTSDIARAVSQTIQDADRMNVAIQGVEDYWQSLMTTSGQTATQIGEHFRKLTEDARADSALVKSEIDSILEHMKLMSMEGMNASNSDILKVLQGGFSGGESNLKFKVDTADVDQLNAKLNTTEQQLSKLKDLPSKVTQAMVAFGERSGKSLPTQEIDRVNQALQSMIANLLGIDSTALETIKTRASEIAVACQENGEAIDVNKAMWQAMTEAIQEYLDKLNVAEPVIEQLTNTFARMATNGADATTIINMATNATQSQSDITGNLVNSTTELVEAFEGENTMVSRLWGGTTRLLERFTKWIGINRSTESSTRKVTLEVERNTVKVDQNYMAWLKSKNIFSQIGIGIKALLSGVTGLTVSLGAGTTATYTFAGAWEVLKTVMTGGLSAIIDLISLITSLVFAWDGVTALWNKFWDWMDGTTERARQASKALDEFNTFLHNTTESLQAAEKAMESLKAVNKNQKENIAMKLIGDPLSLQAAAKSLAKITGKSFAEAKEALTKAVEDWNNHNQRMIDRATKAGRKLKEGDLWSINTVLQKQLGVDANSPVLNQLTTFVDAYLHQMGILKEGISVTSGEIEKVQIDAQNKAIDELNKLKGDLEALDEVAERYRSIAFGAQGTSSTALDKALTNSIKTSRYRQSEYESDVESFKDVKYENLSDQMKAAYDTAAKQKDEDNQNKAQILSTLDRLYDQNAKDYQHWVDAIDTFLKGKGLSRETATYGNILEALQGEYNKGGKNATDTAQLTAIAGKTLSKDKTNEEYLDKTKEGLKTEGENSKQQRELTEKMTELQKENVQQQINFNDKLKAANKEIEAAKAKVDMLKTEAANLDSAAKTARNEGRTDDAKALEAKAKELREQAIAEMENAEKAAIDAFAASLSVNGGIFDSISTKVIETADGFGEKYSEIVDEQFKKIDAVHENLSEEDKKAWEATGREAAKSKLTAEAALARSNYLKIQMEAGFAIINNPEKEAEIRKRADEETNKMIEELSKTNAAVADALKKYIASVRATGIDLAAILPGLVVAEVAVNGSQDQQGLLQKYETVLQENKALKAALARKPAGSKSSKSKKEDLVGILKKELQEANAMTKIEFQTIKDAEGNIIDFLDRLGTQEYQEKMIENLKKYTDGLKKLIDSGKLKGQELQKAQTAFAEGMRDLVEAQAKLKYYIAELENKVRNIDLKFLDEKYTLYIDTRQIDKANEALRETLRLRREIFNTKFEKEFAGKDWQVQYEATMNQILAESKSIRDFITKALEQSKELKALQLSNTYAREDRATELDRAFLDRYRSAAMGSTHYIKDLYEDIATDLEVTGSRLNDRLNRAGEYFDKINKGIMEEMEPVFKAHVDQLGIQEGSEKYTQMRKEYEETIRLLAQKSAQPLFEDAIKTSLDSMAKAMDYAIDEGKIYAGLGQVDPNSSKKYAASMKGVQQFLNDFKSGGRDASIAEMFDKVAEQVNKWVDEGKLSKETADLLLEQAKGEIEKIVDENAQKFAEVLKSSGERFAEKLKSEMDSAWDEGFDIGYEYGFTAEGWKELVNNIKRRIATSLSKGLQEMVTKPLTDMLSEQFANWAKGMGDTMGRFITGTLAPMVSGILGSLIGFAIGALFADFMGPLEEQMEEQLKQQVDSINASGFTWSYSDPEQATPIYEFTPAVTQESVKIVKFNTSFHITTEAAMAMASQRRELERVVNEILTQWTRNAAQTIGANV